jgi:hypothetical protein
MRRIIGVVLLALATLLAAGSTEAQRIEITPFVGYQFGGELAVAGDEPVETDLEQGSVWGLMVNLDITDRAQIEVFYSSQGTELDLAGSPSPSIGIEYLQIGAIHQYAPRKPVNPYVGFTLGATRIDVGGDNDTRFSGGLSVGAKMIVSDHIGFRFDGRIFGITNGSGTIGCSGGVCVGYPDNSIILQYAVNAGLIIRFGV